MPGRDRTGPLGQGNVRRRNFGDRLGMDSRRTINIYAVGPGGHCKCPDCGYIIPHSSAQPCNLKQCPKCGTAMARD